LTAMLEHISRAAAVTYAHVNNKNGENDLRLARSAQKTRQRLIELIRAGDADGAEILWRRHLTEAGRILSEGVGATVVDLFREQ
jgi:GntR family transcriptional repressor for pyruvate dehydrogenase complex